VSKSCAFVVTAPDGAIFGGPFYVKRSGWISALRAAKRQGSRMSVELRCPSHSQRGSITLLTCAKRTCQSDAVLVDTPLDDVVLAGLPKRRQRRRSKKRKR